MNTNLTSEVAQTDIQRVIAELQAGTPIIVHDAGARENECDFFIPAEFCEPQHIRLFRQSGGGVIFLTVAADIWRRLGLALIEDMYSAAERDFPVLQALQSGALGYDKRSAFSISINHRDTYTGVTDNDRARTSREFGYLARRSGAMSDIEAIAAFGADFRSPGHIPLCLASEHGLDERIGHTELSCALSRMAGLSGVCVGCEIMADDGLAKSKEMARSFAIEAGYAFIEGARIVEAWRAFDNT